MGRFFILLTLVAHWISANPDKRARAEACSRLRSHPYKGGPSESLEKQLYNAAKTQKFNLAKKLVEECGTQDTYRDEDGNSALGALIENSRAEGWQVVGLCKLLVNQASSRPLEKNRRGADAIDIAKEKNYGRISHFLLEYLRGLSRARVSPNVHNQGQNDNCWTYPGATLIRAQLDQRMLDYSRANRRLPDHWADLMDLKHEDLVAELLNIHRREFNIEDAATDDEIIQVIKICGETYGITANEMCPDKTDPFSQRLMTLLPHRPAVASFELSLTAWRETEKMSKQKGTGHMVDIAEIASTYPESETNQIEGHAMVIDEYHIGQTLESSYARIKNSWGEGFGDKGQFWTNFRNLDAFGIGVIDVAYLDYFLADYEKQCFLNEHVREKHECAQAAGSLQNLYGWNLGTKDTCLDLGYFVPECAQINTTECPYEASSCFWDEEERKLYFGCKEEKKWTREICLGLGPREVKLREESELFECFWAKDGGYVRFQSNHEAEQFCQQNGKGKFGLCKKSEFHFLPKIARSVYECGKNGSWLHGFDSDGFWFGNEFCGERENELLDRKAEKGFEGFFGACCGEREKY